MAVSLAFFGIPRAQARRGGAATKFELEQRACGCTVKSLHRRDTEITEVAEFGIFLTQERFTPRTEPVLSDVEGRLCGDCSSGSIRSEWRPEHLRKMCKLSSIVV